MNSIARRQILAVAVLAITSLGLVWWVWSYALSFQSVTFEYDDSLGYIELTSEISEPLYPPAGQEVRLKKSTYQLQTIGDNIDSRTREITIASDTNTITTEFSYTGKYLKGLYDKERPAITKLINKTYPKLSQRYTVKQAALYGHGDIYGAHLVATQKSDHSDTLRILLQKKSGKWQVVSQPPTPILSAPDYPDIDSDILRAINRAR